MRTTIDLDEDVLRAARSLARQQETSLSKVVSDLARRGMNARREIDEENGFPVFRVSAGAPPITLEDVLRDADEP